MAFTETLLKPKEKIKVEGYRWIGRPRTTKAGGGVGFLIRNTISNNFTVEPHAESPIEDLWLVTTLADNTRLCIGCYYGKQETLPLLQIRNEFEHLELKTSEMLIQHDHVMLLGDFNAKIGNDAEGIEGNHPVISRNGHMLRTYIQDCSLSLVNRSEVCIGLWTRENTQNPNQRSVLDYVLTSKAITQHITSMVIDEEKVHQLQGKKPSDHNTILLKVNTDIPKIKLQPKPHWKLDSVEWTEFANHIDLPMSQHLQNQYPNPSAQCEEWLQIVLKAGHDIVKKTSGLPPSKDPALTHPNVKLAQLERRTAKKNYEQSLKDGTPEVAQAALRQYKQKRSDFTTALNKEQARIAEEKLKKIIDEGGCSSKTFWNIRRQLKKNNLEDMWALKNDEGTILYNTEEIKAETARYYEELYSPRTNPLYRQDWTDHIQEKIELRSEDLDTHHNHPMNRPISKEEVKNAINQLPLNKSCGPDDIPNEFLKFGGEKLHDAIHSLFTSIFSLEIPPSQWSLSNLINLDKGKGDPQLLSNKRGISLTSNLGKLFERVVNNRVKQYLQFTQAQAGGREGKSCVDHIFVIKSVINQFQKEKKPTFCAFIDLEKAYDKVWPDAIYHALWERGIKGKLWRVMKSLNTGLATVVQTKYGPTKPVNICQSIRQGGVLSVSEFSVLIDCLEEDLQREQLGIQFGDLLIASLLLMDDIVLVSDSSQGLQKMLNVVNNFILRWHLVVNPTKSKVIIFNGNSKTPTMEWKVGDITIKQANEYKYLGEILTHNMDLSRHIIFKKQQAQSMVNLSFAVTGQSPLNQMKVQTLLQFHQRCIIPAILYGCQNWTQPNFQDIEDIQYMCLRQYLKVPKSTPKLALLVETGNHHMSTMIEKQQLTYLWTILSSENSLPFWVYNTQLTHFYNNSDNWATYIKKLLEKYNITHSFNEIRLTKKHQWKKLVQKKIFKKENEAYCAEASTKSKLKNLVKFKTSIGQEAYMNLPRDEASILFRLRTRMLPLKTNMKGQHSNTLCPRCSLEDDDESHLMEVCANLRNQREKYNITTLEEVFSKETKLARLKAIAGFVKECLEI